MKKIFSLFLILIIFKFLRIEWYYSMPVIIVLSLLITKKLSDWTKTL